MSLVSTASLLLYIYYVGVLGMSLCIASHDTSQNSVLPIDFDLAFLGDIGYHPKFIEMVVQFCLFARVSLLVLK